jgi:hypothetical protein
MQDIHGGKIARNRGLFMRQVNYSTASPETKKMFLTYVRQEHPQLYQAALADALKPVLELTATTLGLGALGQDVTDLTATPSVDLTSIDTSQLLNSIQAPSVDISAPTDTSSSLSAGGLFNSLITNITSFAGHYLTSASQQNLLQQNAQRLAQGLPPLNADGTVMTVAQMQAAGYTSAQIAAIEAKITGFSLSTIPWWVWLLGAGAVIYAVA